MKILHICETARGGMATYLSMITQFEEGIFDSRLILPDSHEWGIQRKEITIPFRYPKRSLMSLIRMATTSVRLKMSWAPDIVFLHSSLAMFALIVLKPLSPRTKFIFCPHGWAGAREMKSKFVSFWIKYIEGRLCYLADCVVNISHSDLRFAQQNNYLGYHIVIENAVPEATDVHNISAHQEDIRLLFVGRLDRQKGVDFFLDCFAQARKINPLLKLTIIGEPVVEGSELIVTEGVEVLGWVKSEDLDKYYAESDLVVVPSRWEGFGLVVPEAYRNSVPVMTSDRGALPDLVIPNQTGFVLPLEAGMWIKALASLKKETLKAMKEPSFSMYSKRFTCERLKQELSDLYRRISNK